MALAFDELENNPFYIALETKYIDKFKEAQKKLWLICVPFRKSFKEQAINKDFTDAHILKPSPFFKSHFVSTDANNSASFEIESDIIKTETGIIKILMEETSYNDDYKPYRILIIERPLSCFSKTKDEIQNTASSNSRVQSLNECTSFLGAFHECRGVLKMLDKKIQVFNSSYMVLPQYLQDASSKLRNMLIWAVSEFERYLAHDTFEHYSKSEISTAIENYIMFQVHDKVFPVVTKFCMEEDKQLTQKLMFLHEACVTPDQLGVREPFCCQTSAAVAELSSLISRKCPVEKMNCLMSTLELLNQDINKFLQETCSPVNNKDLPCLTSDDLIPLLVNVIVQCRPEYFVSSLFYIQNFFFESSPVDRVSYGLVTFQAAIEFLKSNEFEFLKSPSRKLKKEFSMKELTQVAHEIENVKKSPGQAKPPQPQSPTDHLLENVSKMIESTTKELKNRSYVKESCPLYQKPTSKDRPQENVGDFLANIRQNSLGLTYGKQT